MSRLRPLSWAILLLCAVLLIWQWAHRPSKRPSAEQAAIPSNSSDATVPGAPRSATARPPELRPAGSDEPVATTATSTPPVQTQSPVSTGTDAVPETPESSSLPGETVLQNLRVSFRQYASAFGENPVGTNPEITSALQGENSKHINFLRTDGNRVNANGELVDVCASAVPKPTAIMVTAASDTAILFAAGIFAAGIFKVIRSSWAGVRHLRIRLAF